MPKAPQETPGERLHRWRRRQGWTVKDLAKRIRFSFASVSHWETGRAVPSFAAALAIERESRGAQQIRVEHWGYNRKTAERAS